MDRWYFDSNATTPLAPDVAAAMTPFLTELHGNPSSHHWAGDFARTAIAQARSQLAMFLNCQPSEVVFTAGHLRFSRTTQRGSDANFSGSIWSAFLRNVDVTAEATYDNRRSA